MKTLVVCGHPDDEVLGCGGTLLKWSGEIDIHFMGHGREDYRELAIESAQALEANHPTFNSFKDNELDSVTLLTIIQAIEPVIEKSNPDRIITHYKGDMNIDHQLTHRAVITACRNHPVTIYSMEIPGSWWKPFNPNTWVTLSPKIVEKKLVLLHNVYGVEMKDYPHPRSYEQVETLMNYRGNHLGFAEAFILEKQTL